MIGKQYFRIKYKRNTITVQLRRNITIITGDSGTGKTTIVKMLTTFAETNGKGPVSLECSDPVEVIPGNIDKAYNVVSTTTNSILVADEDAVFIYSKEFANLVKTSTNYFVLITRRGLPMLSYSYKEMFTLVTKKDAECVACYTSLTDLFNYGSFKVIFDVAVVEDSNSGRDLLCYLFPDKLFDIPISDTVRSGRYAILSKSEQQGFGKSTLFDRACAQLLQSRHVLVFGDGAAIGPYVYALVKLAKNNPGGVSLWLPESIEYFLLTTGIVPPAQSRHFSLDRRLRRFS